MNSTFVDILRKLISEQGREVLLNARTCKALLADYTRGEYKKESRLVLQAIEAGVAKEINGTVELEICKKQQARELQEEYGLAEAVAADIVDTFALVLRAGQKSVPTQSEACKKCGKELQKEWKVCPYCGTPKVQRKPPPAPTPRPTRQSSAPVKQAPSTQSYSTESDFNVKREGYGIKIIGYTGSQRQVNIPPQIQNLPVTTIGKNAFYYCTGFTSVTIPASVTSIGDYAFFRCYSLASVTIPVSVATIGHEAFCECTSLISVTIQGTPSIISDGFFASFDGHLGNKYLAGGPGTYTRESGGTTWWKQ